MNKIFRIVWSHATQSWVAVSELTKAHKKQSRNSLKAAVGAAAVLLSINTAEAEVLIGQVNNGTIAAGGSVVSSWGITIGGAIDKAGSHSVHVGDATLEEGERNVIIGTHATAGVDKGVRQFVRQSTAIGGGGAANEGARAFGDQSIAIGANTIAEGNSSIAIGNDDVDKAVDKQLTYTNSEGNKVTGTLGNAYNNLTGKNLLNDGGQYSDTRSGEAAVAIGVKAESGDISLALGTGAKAKVVNGVAIGTGATVERDNAVALGGGATTEKKGTKETSTTVNNFTFKWAGGDKTLEGDIVSFGKEGYERQLKNVAAGNVSENSTDAINGSQLYGVLDKITSDPTFLYAADNSSADTITGDKTTDKITDAKAKKIVARAMNDGRLNLLGGADKDKLSDNNIGVTYENENTIKFKLAKELTGLTSTNVGGIVTNADGINMNNKPITNVTSGLTNHTEPGKAELRNLKNDTVTDGTAATVGDLRNMGWVVSSNKTTGADGTATDAAYSATVKNANEVKFVGKGGAIVSGSTDANGVRTITVEVDKKATAGAGSSESPVAYTKADGTKVYPVKAEDGSVTYHTTPNGEGPNDAVVPGTEVITSVNGPEGTTTPATLTNVAGNLVGAKKDTTAPTTEQAAPTLGKGANEVNPNNAATVGDVLNAGWNLQNNNEAKDFVKAYDTVNFINGDGTTAVVETTDNKVSKIKYNVNTGNGLEKTTDNKIAVKPGDKSLEVTEAGVTVKKADQSLEVTDAGLKVKTDGKTITAGDNGLTINTGDVNPVESGDKKGTVEVPTADAGKIATVDTVVKAVNSASFTLKASATTDGTRNADSAVDENGEQIKAGSTVELVAGKNLDVKHEANGKITFATKDNVTFETVQVGGDQGPKLSKSDAGDIKVSGSDGTAPVKVTNVKDGDISADSKDAINGSQFHKLAKNTIKLAGKNGEEAATETDTQTLDKENGIAFTVKSSDGKLLEVAAAGDTITLTPKVGSVTTDANGVPTADVSNGKLVTAEELVTALKGMGWKAIAGNDGTGTVTGNTEELVKAGETVTFKAGDNLAVKQAGKDFIYSLKTELTGLTSAEFKNAAGDKTAINADGVTITPVDTTKQPVSLTKDGLNNGGNAITNVAGNLDGAKKDTTTPKTEAAAPNTTNKDGDKYINPNNAATVGDVLNAGWNLQENGTAKDFVKPYDTVNFINGANTTAVVTTSEDGTTSKVTYNVTGLPVSYTTEDGKPVSKVGDKFYTVNEKGQPVTADGKPAVGTNAEGKLVTADGTVIEPIDPTKTPLKTALVNPTPAADKTGTTSPTALNNVTSNLANFAEPTVNGKVPAKNALRNLDNTDVSDNTAATVGDLRNMGWIVSSDKTTGDLGNPYSEAVKNANEVKFVGTGTAIVSGKTDENGVRTITVNVDDQVSANNATTPVVYTKADGTKVYPIKDENGAITYHTTPDGKGPDDQEVPGTEVITSVNSPDGTTTPATLANVAGNLDGAKKDTTAPKAEAAAPNTTNKDGDKYINPNNAATVGDVLNAGWNLQENGTAKDFVKPYDTVNFINGANTTAVVTTSEDGSTNKVTYNVTGLPVSYTTEDGKPVSKVGDKFYKVNEKGQPLAEDGTPAAGTDKDGNPITADGTVIKAIDPTVDPLKTALVNPNAPDAQTTTPTQLTNVANGADTFKPANNVKQANDGKWYNAADVAPNGAPKAGAQPVVSPLTTTNAAGEPLEKGADGNWYKPSELTNGEPNPGATQQTPADKPANAEKAGLVNFEGSNPNNAATVGDLQNLGFIVSAADNGYTEQMRNANKVEFKGSNGVSVTGKTLENGTREITVSLKEGRVTNNVIITKADGTEVHGERGEDGKVYHYEKDPVTGQPKKVEVPVVAGDTVTNDGDAYVTGNSVATAIQKSGWNIGIGSTTKEFSKEEKVHEKVNPNDNVKYVNGDNTTVSMAVDSAEDKDGTKVTTTYVKFDVNAADLTHNINGTVNGPVTAEMKKALDEAKKALADLPANATPEAKKAAEDKVNVAQANINKVGNPVATAQSVADAINNSGFTLTTSGNGGKKLSGKDEVINPGKKVDLAAGKNMTVKQDDEGKVTYATADEVNFSSVQFGDNGPKINAAGDNINIGDKDGHPTKITGVKAGDISPTSTDAVNGAQIYALSRGNVPNVKNITDAAGNTYNNVIVDENGTPILKTYNVQGQKEIITNSVVEAVHNMNEQGIKFFHSNDGVNRPKVETANSFDSSASGKFATAIGKSAVAHGDNAVAMGNSSKALGNDSIAIGTGNIVEANNSGAFGDPNVIKADATGSYAFGNNNVITTKNTFVLGNDVNNAGNSTSREGTVENSVYLGNKSTATAGDGSRTASLYNIKQDGTKGTSTTAGSVGTVTTATVGNMTYGGFQGAKANGVVSVGAAGDERRIQNVAAGEISSTSTDAINGSQLYSVAKGVGNRINNLQGQINKLGNRMNAGMATSAAMANLLQPHKPGQSVATAGVGQHKNQSAVAVGYSRISDNGKYGIRFSMGANTQGEVTGGAAVGYFW
ncbi:ESPR-type extended signal peptide-containing protein [Haemophilus haemolyticus]|uniref:ESPR-type extended signal peptide-containing protein n=1 Tax=Haemophilus haemolyticus TaxID=726 RepID=UPI000E0D02DC|nr:ESPR-type extended signal peptide-containing protein [Haemophilus haemolyticus]